MATSPAAGMMPYRDVNNTQVNYSSGPHADRITQPHGSDSDGEPLIPPPLPAADLDEDSLLRFTATGRPMPAFRFNNLQGLGGADMFSLPQLLPRRYTDESIIPAIVVDVIPAQKAAAGEDGKKRRPSLLGRLKSEKKKEDGKGLTKVVYMPRGDYLKYFARGQAGEYIGTEPHKRWTEEELDETFAQYKPAPRKKGYVPPS